MKSLTLLRHAKSSWADPGARDFDRPLNDRGRAAGKRIGQWIRDRGMTFDHVVASPAVRVAQTLDRIAEGYGDRWEVAIERSVYEASPDALLELVRRIAEPAKSVLIVGHSPGLQLLALSLTRADPEGRRDQVAAKFPTAGLVQIDLPADRWSKVERGSGKVARFVSPATLDET